MGFTGVATLLKSIFDQLLITGFEVGFTVFVGIR